MYGFKILIPIGVTHLIKLMDLKPMKKCSKNEKKNIISEL